MTFRIRLSRYIFQFADFLKTLPIVIMKPEDLIEFSRQGYARPTSVESWSEGEIINQKLWPEEIDMIGSIPINNGRLLLLGVGGGREAIQFAHMGFDVTGIDYVPEMVERSVENAALHGVHIDGLVQEISKLEVTPADYDIVWISRAMYSCIPTRIRRVEMAERIYQALKPGGYFLCQFQRGITKQETGRGDKLRKIIAASPFGNNNYEEGDILWLNVEFLHVFYSEDEIRAELEESGFFVQKINMNHTPFTGSAVCVKQ